MAHGKSKEMMTTLTCLCFLVQALCCKASLFGLISCQLGCLVLAASLCCSCLCCPAPEQENHVPLLKSRKAQHELLMQGIVREPEELTGWTPLPAVHS